VTSLSQDPVFYGTLASLGSLTGAGLTVQARSWLARHLGHILAFAAGTLLSVACLDLVPEAIEMTGLTRALGLLLLGMLGFHVLESRLHARHGDDPVSPGGEASGHQQAMALMAIAGMGFHAFTDGLVLGLGFEVSAATGLSTTVGLLAHALPQGIALASVLLHARLRPWQAVGFAAAIAAMIPIGTLVAHVLPSGLSTAWLGGMLAIAASSFVYVGAVGLLPESLRTKGHPLAFAAGLGLVALVLSLHHG